MYWKTATGVRYPINRLEDTHLANIWWFLNFYGANSEIINTIGMEIKRRNMPIAFLRGAPYPYFDMVDKCWKKWSEVEMRDVEL